MGQAICIKKRPVMPLYFGTVKNALFYKVKIFLWAYSFTLEK